MKTILIALAATALAAGPGLAQPAHPEHHPAAAAATATPDAPTHEMCKGVMGKHMDPKVVHEHSREKGGPVMWPNGKPLTKAEMQKMHERCAARMAAEPAK